MPAKFKISSFKTHKYEIPIPNKKEGLSISNKSKTLR